MLNRTEMLEYLNQLPRAFKDHYAEGRYAAAAMDHEGAAIIPYLLDIDPQKRECLLAGFNQQKVESAYKRSGRWKDA